MRTQAIAAPTGGEYGSRKASLDLQRAVPLPQTPPPALAAGAAPVYAQPGATDFAGDSAAPAEPVTAGLSVGPGPGPESLVGRVAPSAGLEAAAFKVDVLRSLATLPFASPEVKLLLKQAVNEMSQFTSAPVPGPPPAAPTTAPPPEAAPPPDAVPPDAAAPAPVVPPDQVPQP